MTKRDNAIIETQGLSKRYGGVSALEDCTLSVARGEVFGLLGPNGAGKTTLLRLLMGFLRPTRGRAAIGGRDCSAESVAVHADVSYLPGDVRLPRGMKARDVLSFFARLRAHDYRAGIRLAERLGLDLSRKVAQMSTGMRQKLAVAAVLAVDVPLLVVDEPTSNLDPTVRSVVLELIREAQSARRTVVFSSHIISEVEQVCDRVVILREGRVVHDQQMREIRRGHRIRARLAGELPVVPAGLAGKLSVSQVAGGEVMIDAPGELAPLLGWLATLPLSQINIEPIGLQAVYEQYHSAQRSGEVAA
jgi:ABC-2 type transport system ATP-binding protein